MACMSHAHPAAQNTTNMDTQLTVPSGVPIGINLRWLKIVRSATPGRPYLSDPLPCTVFETRGGLIDMYRNSFDRKNVSLVTIHGQGCE